MTQGDCTGKGITVTELDTAHRRRREKTQDEGGKMLSVTEDRRGEVRVTEVDTWGWSINLVKEKGE